MQPTLFSGDQKSLRHHTAHSDHSKKQVPWAKLTINPTIRGRLVHPNLDPMTNQKIALFKPHFPYDERIYKTETTTNENGEFAISYKWTHRKYEKEHSINLAVFEEKVLSEHSNVDRKIGSVSLAIPNIDGNIHVRDIQFRLYERDESFPIPLLKIESNQKNPQQSNFSQFTEPLAKGVAVDAAIVINALHKKVFSTEKATKILETINAVSLTPEASIDCLLNFTMAHFTKGSNENELVYDLNWDGLKKKPLPDLANLQIVLIKEEDKLRYKEITVEYSDSPAQTFKPGEPGFMDAINKAHSKNSALYVSNCMGFIEGEFEHLTQHLILGSMALSFFRHINNHPIKKFLTPLLDGVSEINRAGAGLIFGKNGLLTLSGLPQWGVKERLGDKISNFDFTIFSPRKGIVSNHTSANLQELFWEVATEAVDAYFAEHEVAIKSPENWFEVYYMAKHLVEESMPYKEAENSKAAWIDRSDMDRPEVPGRVEKNGFIRAIRPFITSKDKPDVQSIEGLKQFCRYVIFAVFNHWLLHSTQDKWGSNPNFAVMSPNRKKGGDWGGSDTISAAIQALGVRVITEFKALRMMDDLFAYEPLKKALEKRRERFEKNGCDIEKIHSAIWI